MTRRALSEILALFEASYRIKFRPQEVRAWELLLAPLSDENGKRAAIVLCQKSPYVPKPADIFKLVEEYREAHRYPPPPALMEPSNPDAVARGVALLREAVERIGTPPKAMRERNAREYAIKAVRLLSSATSPEVRTRLTEEALAVLVRDCQMTDGAARALLLEVADEVRH